MEELENIKTKIKEHIKYLEDHKSSLEIEGREMQYYNTIAKYYEILLQVIPKP